MIRYMLKSALKDRELLIYTFLFPIFMLLLYNVAFSSFESRKVEIPIAVRVNDERVNILKQIPILQIRECEESEAISGLKNEDVVGYIRGDGSLIVKRGGFRSTFLKSLMDTFLQVEMLGLPVGNYDFQKSYTDNINQNTGVQGYALVFYAFFAMVAMQSAHSSMNMIQSFLANQSALGERMETSPVGKRQMLVSTVVVSTVINFLALCIAVVFTIFILKKDIFSYRLQSFTLLLLLNLLGVVFGMFVGVTFSAGAGAKSAAITITLLLISTIGGMITPDLKNAVGNHVPFINSINPIAIFSDTMLRMNTGRDVSMFGSALLRLGIEVLILASFSLFLFIRRKKYDSL